MNSRFDLAMKAIRLINIYAETNQSHSKESPKRILRKARRIIDELITIEEKASECLFREEKTG